MKDKTKKEYQIPEFNYLPIKLLTDVLSASQPGGGNWGYFDEDPTKATDPYVPDDDFWD